MDTSRQYESRIRRHLEDQYKAIREEVTDLPTSTNIAHNLFTAYLKAMQDGQRLAEFTVKSHHTANDVLVEVFIKHSETLRVTYNICVLDSTRKAFGLAYSTRDSFGH